MRTSGKKKNSTTSKIGMIICSSPEEKYYGVPWRGGERGERMDSQSPEMNR